MKNSRLVALLVALGSTPASAEIIIQQGGGYSFQYGVPYQVVVVPSTGLPMSTIIITQPVVPSSPMVQRAHAWSAYQKNNNSSGSALILQPYTGAESDAQILLNRNMSRAHAFRLGY